jgi:AcrR family transcriptional regulator
MPRKAGRSGRPVSRAGGSGPPRPRDVEVLHAAAEIFYVNGYANSTVQDIADAVGMLKGSLYYYIDGKEDLLYRLVNEIHDGVEQALTAAFEAQGVSALERLELYVRQQVTYNAHNLKKVSVYYHDIDQLSGKRRRDIEARRRTHDNRVVDLIRDTQAEGQTRADLDARLLANYIFGTIIWTYRWYRPEAVPAAELANGISRFVRYGLTGTEPLRHP